jgi:large subunit ribosomal protein L16
MTLQPKTRKYRVNFRNKTQKKTNQLTCSYQRLNKETKLKEKATYKIIGYSQLTQLKRNLKDNLGIVKLTSKKQATLAYLFPKIGFSAAGKLLTESSKALFQHREYSPFIQNQFINTESILISKHKDSSNICPDLMQKPLGTHTTATQDKVRFGQAGIYFTNSGTITVRFLETARLAVARKLKKVGRFWIRIGPDTPVTARSAETRMGRGKGAISHYEAKIKAGQMFIEFSGVSCDNLHKIYAELSKKSPIKIKLIA